eukprot:scaffold98417_cov61-Attheya_sp.AAC.1
MPAITRTLAIGMLATMAQCLPVLLEGCPNLLVDFPCGLYTRHSDQSFINTSSTMLSTAVHVMVMIPICSEYFRLCHGADRLLLSQCGCGEHPYGPWSKWAIG